MTAIIVIGLIIQLICSQNNTLRKKIILLLLAIIVGAFVVSDVTSYTSGAPDGFTGSPFDDQTCATYCHHGNAETPLDGILSSDIPPTGYVPGNTYTILANIVRPGHSKFGFQVSPMDDHGNVLGTMVQLTNETQITGMGTYITHSQSGTTGIDSKSWNFEWIAPEAGTGSVTFYGAFNATNNNSSNNGDSIFTTTYTVQEDITVGVASIQSLNDIVVYPNPAKDFITINTPALAKQITVRMYNIEGGEADIIYSGGSSSGLIPLPKHITPGIYFISVTIAEKTFAKKIIVL